jgi:hypothetical protein
VDLRVPLDLTIDPVKTFKALERTHIALLGKVVDIEDTRHRVSSTLCEYITAQSSTPAGEARGPLLRVQAGRRRNERHRPTKTWGSTAGATAL